MLNPIRIDSAALISSGSGCSGAGGLVQIFYLKTQAG